MGQGPVARDPEGALGEGTGLVAGHVVVGGVMV